MIKITSRLSPSEYGCYALKSLSYFPDYRKLKFYTPNFFVSLRNLEKCACNKCGYIHEIPKEKDVEWTCSICGSKNSVSLRKTGKTNKITRCPICEAEFTDNNYENLVEKWGNHVHDHNL